MKLETENDDGDFDLGPYKSLGEDAIPPKDHLKMQMPDKIEFPLEAMMKTGKQNSAMKLHAAMKLESSDCTAANGDPYASGGFKDCCAGSTSQLVTDSHGWHYKCVRGGSSGDCTKQGGDPYSSSKLVPCCDGLAKKLHPGKWTFTCEPTSGPSPPPAPVPAPGGHDLPHQSVSGIKVKGKRSDNYVMILGDWGNPYSKGRGCQRAVAAKMKAYARSQAQKGKNLLAVVSVGDNFYWSGNQPHMWAPAWSNIYGVHDSSSGLKGVPWLSCFGNHDYGNADPYLFCPNSTHQPNQLTNSPSRPGGTELFHADYQFYVEIPELSFEMIFVDTNLQWITHAHGGLSSAGFPDAVRKCGGQGKVKSFLRQNIENGNRLLRERARNSKANTTLIVNHYPNEYSYGFRDTEKAFKSALGGRHTNIISAAGHAHKQDCQGGNDPHCTKLLSGGGGGCCHSVDGDLGFAVVHLTDEPGGFTTDISSRAVRLKPHECKMDM